MLPFAMVFGDDTLWEEGHLDVDAESVEDRCG